MNRFSASTAVAILAAVSIGGITVGCSHTNEADETRMQGNQLLDASGLIGRGQKNVEDGRAMVARGEAMIKNDEKVQGEDMIAEGNAQIKYGESQIKQGEDLRDKAR